MLLPFDESFSVRTVRWPDLRPGMVVIGGVEINGAVPYELRRYPVMTDELLNELRRRYQFLTDRRLVVADLRSLHEPEEASAGIARCALTAEALNRFRDATRVERERIEERYGASGSHEAWRQHGTVASLLVRDRYNSFTLPFGFDMPGLKPPSLFSAPQATLKLADLLGATFKRIAELPENIPVTLHVVVSYSSSMDRDGRLDSAAACAQYLNEALPAVLPATAVNLYAFSDSCKRVAPPYTGTEVERAGSNYSPFMREVLRNREAGRHNMVVLICDAAPDDCEKALRGGAAVREAGVDYTQIMLGGEDGTTTRGEPAGRFASVASACNGNQEVLTTNGGLRLAAVDWYDRYLGLLTVARRTGDGRPYDTNVTGAHRYRRPRVRRWDWRRR